MVRRCLGAGIIVVSINSLHAQTNAVPTVNWVSDSTSSFDVVLSGTGLGWTGTISSPSGLWQLQSANVINFGTAGFPSSLVFVDNVGVATFEGQLPPDFPVPNSSDSPPFNTPSLATFGGYWDGFNPVLPVNDGNTLDYGYLNKYGKWSGDSTISITSIPSLCDTSTWTWTAEYSAAGLNLDPVATPEPCALCFFSLAAVIGLLRAVQCSKSPGRAHDGSGAGGGTRP